MSCASLMENEPAQLPRNYTLLVFVRLSKTAAALRAKIVELLCVSKGNKIWTTLGGRQGN